MVANNLRVTTVQTDLVWEDKTANLSLLSSRLESLQSPTDLVVLPEMFTTGFSMNASVLAEGMDGPTVDWMRRQSALLGAAVTGSFVAKENGRYYNRLVFMLPDGNYRVYDKRHLFTLAGEHQAYEAGTEKKVVEWLGWKICPLVCYDLRFPVWSRNVEGYDLAVYVANWPERRAHHWRQLLMARAIENQAYLIGVNRIGKDGNGHQYCGDTTVIDYSGEILHSIAHQENISTTSLSYEKLHTYRKSLQFLNDKDEFEIFIR